MQLRGCSSKLLLALRGLLHQYKGLLLLTKLVIAGREGDGPLWLPRVQPEAGLLGRHMSFRRSADADRAHDETALGTQAVSDRFSV